MSTNSTDFGGESDPIVNLDIGGDDDDGPAVPPPPSAGESADAAGKQRGRGRPRKFAVPPPAAAAPQPQKPRSEESSEERDERKSKQAKIVIIERLQKQLGAVGTGLRPTMYDSIEDLDAEIDALNSDLNTKRGDKAVKKLTLMLMPLIELAVDKMVPKEKFDLSTYRHLKEEVEDNWEMFEEAVQHIAILHSSWFAVTPYHELASSTYACAMSVNAKNQAYRARGLPPPAPHNSPESDDETTTGDEDIDDK